MRPTTSPLAAALLLVTAGTPARSASPQDDPHHEPKVRQPLPPPEVIAELPPDGGPEFNRLVFETSPYLLQHARNPVDWYPWGEEAFRAAKAQNKPVFLSIGYSTCHWCHVMEHESFEDADVAALLNESFVCVKVDREERPDLDHVYMTVTQAVTGRGGWPMTVVMTPDKLPFFCGTYYPKKGRYGRPGMLDLLPRLAQAWAEQRDEVVKSAEHVTQQLRQMVVGTPGDGLEPAVLDRAAQNLARRFDATHGGFGEAPKFPVPHNLRLLLRHWRRTGDEQALAMVEKTLTTMRRGGIWDHIGHGFHRYSTDQRWLVPHFEKMLYDQALLVMAYVEAAQATGKAEYERTAREVLEYVRRDMTDPGGGFYSAEDADSEGEEGLFYLWTTGQLTEVLGEDDGALAAEVFRATDEGNFRDEATGQKNGRNILHLTRDLEEHAAERGEEVETFLARMASIRERLFEAREPRIHPLKDDKILTDWNGLMIAAYALAARAFEDEDYADTARRAAEHLLGALRREDGDLYKLARLGVPAGDGLFEDYAYAAWGLLELFETTQEPRWLAAARELSDRMAELFQDTERGGFYLAPAGTTDLIARPKEAYDGALPSGNSVAAGNLLRLARLTGETRYEELAAGVFEAFTGDVERGPGAYTQMLSALSFAVGPTHEVVVAGDPAAADTRAILAGLGRAFRPNAVVLLRPPGDGGAIVELAPYAAEQRPVGDRATVYVCRDFTCQAPVHDLEAVLAALGALGAPEAQAESGD